MNTQIISRTTIGEIVSYRNAALAKMSSAVEALERGHAEALEAVDLATKAHQNTPFMLNDRTRQESYARLFKSFDREASFQTYRQQMDAQIWMHLITVTGMSQLMDRTARDTLYKDLCGSVVEVTEENAYAMFEGLLEDAELIFQRGLARAFGDLDRRFKSHDSFKFDSRVILTHMFNDWGGWNSHSRMMETLADIERVFAVLDKQKPDANGLREAISKDRGGYLPHQSVTETPYFRIKGYKNGNAHLWFTREDLVEKANKVLAAYYGEVLPDAAPHPNDMSDKDLHSKSGELSTQLQFYPTPKPVMDYCLQGLNIGPDDIILEPSAGEGGMVRELLKTPAKRIDAIEVDASRAALMGVTLQNSRMTVQCANFLTMHARPEYDHVIMNPPFHGTHWMQHVMHAFDFLKPGGHLTAVLPVTAELGESRKHVVFREWVEKHTPRYTRAFQDLPAESFASSGTRINTVILRVRKP